MKNLKKILVKTLLFAIVLSMSAAMCVGAEDALQNVYSQNFESFSLTDENFPESKIGYTAEIVNEALQIKSDNVTDWQLKDTSYPNAAGNAVNGIWVTCNANNALVKHEPPFETNDGLFEYTGNSTTAWAIESIGGRDALRLVYFPSVQQANGSWEYKNNEYRVCVESGRFTTAITTYDVELDLYIPSGKKPNQMTFLYKTLTGYGRVYLQGEELANAPVDEWFTWSFTASDADFSQPNLIYNEATLLLQMSGGKFSTSYIGRLSIAPSADGEYIYTSNEKTVKIPFGLGEVYGNTRVSFDVNLPATERYDSLTMYNNGNNSAMVSVTNENDKPIATVQIDSTDDGQSIYAVTGYGKVLLYEGDILGRTLSYQFDVDWKEKTYTLVIKNASEFLDGVTEMYGPYAIENIDAVRGNALVRGLFIKHNAASEHMMTILDNISVNYKEDPDYANCKTDAENLSLDIPESGIITEAFDLPTVGETSGANITWESSNPAVIAISGQGDSFTLTRAATRVTVTLTATLDINGVKILKSFDVVVEKSDDQIRAEEDAEAVVFPISGLAIEDFDLPTEGVVNGSSISWASSDSAITVANNRAVLTRGARQTEVTLTATVNFNGYTAKRDFIVVVCEHDDFLKAKADVEAIVLAIPQTGRVKEDFILPSAGTVNTSAITWTTSDASAIAVSGNSAQVTRYETNKEVTLTASATLGGFTATRKFKVTSATLRGVSAEIGVVQETVSNGYLSANVNVQYPGKTGTLNFLVLITNPETGEILARGVDTKPLTNATRYATIPCSVSNLPFEEGNVAEYYVWNDKRESFVNSEPTAVTELTAIGRGKGVRLNWEPVIDDNNAVEYYEVYRDGAYIGTAMEETYLDESAEVGVIYDYEVRGVDANDLSGAADDEICTPALGMYYFNFEKMANGEENYSNGITYRQSNSGDSHSWFEEVVDANGEKIYAATTYDKNIIGSTDKTLISGSDADLTVEIDYLDTTGNIRMIYNGIIPQGQEETIQLARKSVTAVSGMGGTYEWKTAAFRITDAQFRNSSYWSSSDFGFASTSPGKMFIREIRMIQTDLYD